jgi:hypothetical protein
VVATRPLAPGGFAAARALIAAELPRLRLPPEAPPEPDAGLLTLAFDPPIAGQAGIGRSDPVPADLVALQAAVLRAAFGPERAMP